MTDIEIKVILNETGKVECFTVGEEDSMGDVLDALGLDSSEYEVEDKVTGRFFDPDTSFGEAEKTSFVVKKK